MILILPILSLTKSHWLAWLALLLWQSENCFLFQNSLVDCISLCLCFSLASCCSMLLCHSRIPSVFLNNNLESRDVTNTRVKYPFLSSILRFSISLNLIWIGNLNFVQNFIFKTNFLYKTYFIDESAHIRYSRCGLFEDVKVTWGENDEPLLPSWEQFFLLNPHDALPHARITSQKTGTRHPCRGGMFWRICHRRSSHQGAGSVAGRWRLCHRRSMPWKVQLCDSSGAKTNMWG